MRFTFAGTEYVIGFAYSRNTKKRFTGCAISEAKKDGAKVGAGLSRCALTDTFCKEIGRKLALERALDSVLTVSNEDGSSTHNSRVLREFRTLAWKAYWDRKQPVKAQAVGR